MSFSCPHFEFATEQCLKLNALCVPGRPGCVLGSKAVFAVPVEERLEARGEKPHGKTAVRREADPVGDRTAPKHRLSG